MEGFKDRLIISIRFIYDFNFIYLFFALLNYLIIVVLEFGSERNYWLLWSWHEIMGLDRVNDNTWLYQILFIPLYNFIEWLLTAKYVVVPNIITKHTKGKVSFLLKVLVLSFMFLYAITVSVSFLIHKEDEETKEAARIYEQLQFEKDLMEAVKIEQQAKQKAQEEQKKREKYELSLETIPFQGLSCKLGFINETRFKPTEIVLVLRKHKADQLNSLREIDLRTSKNVIDGVIYDFVRFKSRWIESSSSEISLQLGFRNSLSEIDTGDYLYNGDKLIFSRSSLQLILDKGRNQKLQYQCELVNHEDLYSFVEKQNASITSQNKF